MNNKRSVKKYSRKRSIDPRKKSVRHKISRRKSVHKRKKSVKRKSASIRKKSVKRKSLNRRKRDGMDESSTAKPKKLNFDFVSSESESELETPKKQIIFSPDKRDVDNTVLNSLIDAFLESSVRQPDLKTGTPELLKIGGTEKVSEPLKGEAEGDSEPSKGVDLKRGKPDIENSPGLSPPLKKPKI